MSLIDVIMDSNVYVSLRAERDALVAELAKNEAAYNKAAGARNDILAQRVATINILWARVRELETALKNAADALTGKYYLAPRGAALRVLKGGIMPQSLESEGSYPTSKVVLEQPQGNATESSPLLWMRPPKVPLDPKAFGIQIWDCNCGYCDWIRKQFAAQGLSRKDWGDGRRDRDEAFDGGRLG